MQKISILKFVLVLIVYMIISISLTVLVIRYSIRISKEQAKQEFVVNQYNLLSSQYDQLRNNYVNYKKLRHDLKKTTLTLLTVCHKKQTKKN